MDLQPHELKTAVELTVREWEPEQIILFGSCAKGLRTKESDIDLLAITDDRNGGAPEAYEERQDDETGCRIEVVVRHRSTVEEKRTWAAAVEAAAVEEGTTIYLKNGAAAIATGPQKARVNGMMVESTLFKPEKADEFTRKAKDQLRFSEVEEVFDDTRCQALQMAMEFALKALIVAQGMRVRHTHDLNALWNQAEEGGMVLPAERNKDAVARLSIYGSRWKYDAPTDEDPTTTRRETKETVGAVVRHAEDAVPGLTYETRRKLEEQEAALRGEGRQPVGGGSGGVDESR